jgi:hypothetical protein
MIGLRLIRCLSNGPLLDLRVRMVCGDVIHSLRKRFLELFLSCGIGFGMPRSRDIGAVSQAQQNLPATLQVDCASQRIGHLFGDFWAAPNPAIWGRAVEGLLKFDELRV